MYNFLNNFNYCYNLQLLLAEKKRKAKELKDKEKSHSENIQDMDFLLKKYLLTKAEDAKKIQVKVKKVKYNLNIKEKMTSAKNSILSLKDKIVEKVKRK
jgi:hypothetical protein